MLGYRTLVLNADYTPIGIIPLHTIPAEDAITRVFNGTCYITAEHDVHIKTANYIIKWPSVIVRKEMAKWDRHVALRVEYLYYRDHAICAYCGVNLTLRKEQYNSITKDHVMPKIRGGSNEWNNVVSACPKCNNAKSDSLPKGEWRPRIRAYTPTYYQLVEARRNFSITIPYEDWIPYLGKWKAPINILQSHG